jgi:hypothetical protein
MLAQTVKHFLPVNERSVESQMIDFVTKPSYEFDLIERAYLRCKEFKVDGEVPSDQPTLDSLWGKRKAQGYVNDLQEDESKRARPL